MAHLNGASGLESYISKSCPPSHQSINLRKQFRCQPREKRVSTIMAARQDQYIRKDLSNTDLFRLCVYHIYNHPQSIVDGVRRFNNERNPQSPLKVREVKPTYDWLHDSNHEAFVRFSNGTSFGHFYFP